MVSLKEEMIGEVESILIHSQDYPFDLNAENLISKWENAKGKFIKSFGGKTVVRSRVSVRIYLSEEQRKKRFNEFLDILNDNEILTPEFESFLRDNEKGFFDNKVLLPYPSFNIPLGSKLSKSFKRFLNSSETIRWAQDTASRYIQENKIEGYLYLSVDPRDFLTLSENNERWWSCQTLDGDYRAGNINYMVDSTTIVAYLADDQQQHLKCLPKNMLWNSKKWRMLIHIADGSIYYNKPYPYESKELLYEVYDLLSQYFYGYLEPIDCGFKVVQTAWGGDTISFNQLYLQGRVHDTRDVIDVSDYLGYSDLLYSSSFVPIVSINDEKLNKYRMSIFNNDRKDVEDRLFHEIFDIKIGEKVPCPCCGQEFLNRDNSFLCPTCIAEQDADEDFYLRCDSCYHRIYEEDDVFWMDGRPYCKECFSAMQQEDELTIEEQYFK